jgi:hypothetical protein
MATPAGLVRNLWGGLGRAPDPAGTHASSVEAPGNSKHAGQMMAMHRKQLVVHIGEAGGTLAPWLGDGSVGGFAEKLHYTGTKPPRCF